MDVKLDLQAELNRPDGSTGSGQEIRAFITAALARIVELEDAKALLERGSREAALALAQQRGTISALQARCREYARHSD